MFPFRRLGAILAVCVACGLMIGCGEANHYSAFSPQFKPDSNSRFAVGTVTDSADPIKRTDIPADFSPSAQLKTYIEQRLESHRIKSEVGGADVFVLTPTITDYDPGNAFRRWLAPGTGSTVLIVSCKIEKGGVDLGTIKSRRIVDFGGAYTIGQWNWVFGYVADDIVDALNKRIQDDK